MCNTVLFVGMYTIIKAYLKRKVFSLCLEVIRVLQE